MWKIGRLRELNDPLDCQPSIIFAGDKKQDAESTKGWLEQIQNEYGVLCYSAKITDPVIWSHYADRHTGIALGFEADYSVANYEVMKYQNSRRKITLKEITRTSLFPTRAQYIANTISKGFTVKAESWGYEEEYRSFIELDRCEMRGTHYFFPIRKEHLKQVVLGVNCSLSKEDIFRVLVRGGYSPKVEVSRCFPSDSTFTLNLDTTLRPRSP